MEPGAGGERSEGRHELGAVDAAVTGETGGGRHAAGADGDQGGLVDLDEDRGLREPAGDVVTQETDGGGEGLGQLAPGPVVGQEPVAHGAFDGGRQ